MKIISWNINGIRAILKKNFLESLKTFNADIVCLQETKANKDIVFSSLSSLPKYQVRANTAEKKGYSGTSLLSKVVPLTIKNGLGIEEYDDEGRLQCAEYENFYLINVYVPNSGQKLERLDYRKRWDVHFLKYLKKLEKKKPIIACGDFNVAHKAIDLKNDKANYNKSAGYTQIEIDGMDNLISSGFVDSFRYLHPNKISYTYWSYRYNARARNIGWRVDYILLSKSLVGKLKSATIYSNVTGSDHCPVGLDISM